MNEDKFAGPQTYIYFLDFLSLRFQSPLSIVSETSVRISLTTHYRPVLHVALCVLILRRCRGSCVRPIRFDPIRSSAPDRSAFGIVSSFDCSLFYSIASAPSRCGAAACRVTHYGTWDAV